MQTNSIPKTAVVWSQPNCPACVKAKALLAKHSIDYTELLIGSAGVSRDDFFAANPGARSVPQVWINGALVGDYTKLAEVLARDNP